MKAKVKGIIPFLLTALLTALISCGGAFDNIDPARLLDPSGPGNLLRSIAIVQPPYKTDYELYEKLDLTGVLVLETYSDGSSFTVGYDHNNLFEEGYTISDFDSSSSGMKTITVSKNGLSDSFVVTVGYAGAKYQISG